MRLLLWFVLTLQVSIAAFAGGCGSTERPPKSFPACSEVDWVGRANHAQLTDAPTFSALEIARGDPLNIAVPVDVNTRSVSVVIASANQPGVGSGGEAETSGGESVDILVRDTNLPVGVYFANVIRLEGDRADRSAVYIGDLESPYVLSVLANADTSDLCLTEIAAPTFRVVSDASVEP